MYDPMRPSMQLHRVVGMDDAAEIEAFLRANESVLTNEMLTYGFQNAIREGHVNSVSGLAQALRGNPIVYVEAIQTGLLFAASHGRREILERLVEWSADPLARFGGDTLLHAAGEGRGEAETLRWLTRFIAVDTPNAEGRTALMLAARQLRWEPVVTLGELGADASLCDSNGLRALDYAKRGLADSEFDPEWLDDRKFPPYYDHVPDATSGAEAYAKVRQALESS